MASQPAPVIVSDATPVAVLMAAPTIEADEANFDNDADSTFAGSEAGSSLNYGSITSSIYNYRLENGRTYHAYQDGKYTLPNDEQEQDRLDMVYHAFMVLFDGKPFFAPVENPQGIVDMGTGTGVWALDVGDAYPGAHVIGIDLSPQQPKWVAPNVEPWVFDKPFDLVHSRICAGLAIKDWSAYLAESYKHLRPGGWVEAQEFSLDIKTDDGSMGEDSKVLKFSRLCAEGLAVAGGDGMPTSAGLKSLMEAAGFVNVTAIDYKLPIGPWAKDARLKEAGGMAMKSMIENMSGVSMGVFTRLLGWNRIEVELFITEVKKEWMQRGNHGYWPVMVAYGQKPKSKYVQDEVEVEDGPAVPAATAA